MPTPRRTLRRIWEHTRLWVATAVMGAVIVAWVLLVTGCASFRARTPAPAPHPVPVGAITAGHEAKDATIEGEAAKIDAIAPAARPHTDAQRAALAAAPAAELKPAFAILESRISELTKANEKQAAHIAALQDAELRSQVRSMRIFGLGCLLAAIALGYARQIQFSVVAGGLGALSLGAAQLWASVASHPLFQPVLGGSIVLALAGLAWAAVHAYRKGDLAAKTEREAARLKETLAVIVPVLDEAKATLGDAFAPTISRLSSKMDSAQKQVVKQVRAAI